MASTVVILRFVWHLLSDFLLALVVLPLSPIILLLVALMDGYLDWRVLDKAKRGGK